MHINNIVNNNDLNCKECIPDLHCACEIKNIPSPDCWYEKYKNNDYNNPRWLKKYEINCPFDRYCYLKGKYGITSYVYSGKIENDLVITFHGFNSSIAAFRETIASLTNAGFSVLSFDIYSHGLSSTPKFPFFKKAYTLDFFVEQLRELLKFLKLEKKAANLLGTSMGCCIAARYCQLYPEYVDKLIFVSPAGHLQVPTRIKLIKRVSCVAPISGCFIRPFCFNKLKNKNLSIWKRTMWLLFVKKRGPLGILTCLNRIPLWNCPELYEGIGKIGKPTLILWGKKDRVIPTNISCYFKRVLSNSLLITFNKCGHLALNDRPVEAISTVIAFLTIKEDTDIPLQVSAYRNWLPFTEEGNYILEADRWIDNNDDSDQTIVTIDDYEFNN